MGENVCHFVPVSVRKDDCHLGMADPLVVIGLSIPEVAAQGSPQVVPQWAGYVVWPWDVRLSCPPNNILKDASDPSRLLREDVRGKASRDVCLSHGIQLGVDAKELLFFCASENWSSDAVSMSMLCSMWCCISWNFVCECGGRRSV